MKGPVDTAERNYINRVGNQVTSSPGSHGSGQRVENEEPDFSEYMWMAEELEEFDKKVEEELWEQMFLDDCINGLLDDDDDDPTEEGYWWIPPGQQQPQQPQLQPQQQQQPGLEALNYQMSMLNMRPNNGWSGPRQVVQAPQLSPVVVANSSLNPNAPEFVPRGQPVYYGQER